jgi:hypothetical protein
VSLDTDIEFLRRNTTSVPGEAAAVAESWGNVERGVERLRARIAELEAEVKDQELQLCQAVDDGRMCDGNHAHGPCRDPECWHHSRRLGEATRQRDQARAELAAELEERAKLRRALVTVEDEAEKLHRLAAAEESKP